MAKKDLYTPANFATLIRLFLTIALYYFASQESIRIFVILYVLAGISDSLDGFLARKLGHSSKKGAWLDSIVDHIFYLSNIFWLIWLIPEVLNESAAFIIIFALLFVYVTAKVVMTNRLEFIHLWPSKFAGGALYILVIGTLLLGFYPIAIYAYIVILAFALIYELRYLSK